MEFILLITVLTVFYFSTSWFLVSDSLSWLVPLAALRTFCAMDSEMFPLVGTICDPGNSQCRLETGLVVETYPPNQRRKLLRPCANALRLHFVHLNFYLVRLKGRLPASRLAQFDVS